jgi:hypothetical protein
MGRAFAEDEMATASGNARLEGMIAASRILLPKLFDPICGGNGLAHSSRISTGS